MAILKSKRRLSGTKVSHHKNTSERMTADLPVPKTVTIPLLQHMGTPCELLVRKGDTVKVGQKIGESSAFLSVPIHASCSGTVTDIIEYHAVSGTLSQAVVIETDGQQTLSEDCVPPTVSSKETFLAAVKASGACGLGGAGFPTFAKLSYKDPNRVQTLVVNAAECEPYITSDYRECMENGEDIADGIRALKKYMQFKNVSIGVEDNKPAAIEALNVLFAPEENINIVQLKSVYPQGAEKSIIYAACGVVIPKGKLPADCGVVVMNISTVGFLGKYLKDGVPLISRRITVDGGAVRKPGNYRVPVGMPAEAILTYCAADFSRIGKVLLGGPMMGITAMSGDTPILKNNNAILVMSREASKPQTPSACIRCGKCLMVCPVNLMPLKLEQAYDAENVSMLKEYNLNLCINCGCCSYICPAKRHLAQKHQMAKILLRQKG